MWFIILTSSCRVSGWVYWLGNWNSTRRAGQWLLQIVGWVSISKVEGDLGMNWVSLWIGDRGKQVYVYSCISANLEL